MTDEKKKRSGNSNFRHFFLRGLAVLLPTVLTIWILVAAYGFVRDRIATPINDLTAELIITTTPWPKVLEDEKQAHIRELKQNQPSLYTRWSKQENFAELIERDTRREKLAAWWANYWYVLDLIGFVVAVIIIYTAGMLLGSFLGRRVYARGEAWIKRLPLVSRVYPFVKQVTDFLVGDEKQELRFNRVVAVEYPRKGLYSLGLVTGETMRDIQSHIGQPCVTVFVPSSPTPFTGYVITVPKVDTIDLNITIEEALRFSVSGGVIIPPSQLISPARSQDSLFEDQGKTLPEPQAPLKERVDADDDNRPTP